MKEEVPLQIRGPSTKLMVQSTKASSRIGQASLRRKKFKVIDERARLGIKRDTMPKKKNRFASATNATKKVMSNLLKEMKVKKRQLASLTRKQNGDDSGEENIPDDAGNSFGCKNQKKKAKSSD